MTSEQGERTFGEFHDATSLRIPTTSSPSDIRVPTFSPDKPALWFAQLEAQFALRKVVTELDKFYHAVSRIDTRHAAEVEDIITNPPVTTPYQTLKTALIGRFSSSKEAKLKQLLHGEQIGDRTPSSFLRHLRALVSDVDEDVLKSCWTSGLPEQTRALLAVVSASSSLTELGETADKLHEVIQSRQTAAVSTQQAPQSTLEQRIEALTKQVASLSSAFGHRSRSRSRATPRSRSTSGQRRSRGNVDSGICFFHQRFGDRAKKCRAPCKFSGNEPESH